ncbi:hypothetical protein DPMN_017869 [Dreissena polymorpha]|uniref:Uncharacterized protein n=1 Tax=Dreissena polymorpha TaxID=45954 RepID=A0A9D4NHQ9_DREPO|nr:hypothetical protein DPMN_017869 [Dreissena polymorpha]
MLKTVKEPSVNGSSMYAICGQSSSGPASPIEHSDQEVSYPLMTPQHLVCL